MCPSEEEYKRMVLDSKFMCVQKGEGRERERERERERGEYSLYWVCNIHFCATQKLGAYFALLSS